VVEIKNAYLKLCLAFHPDKQTDSSLKLASQRIFNTIHTAYTGRNESNICYSSNHLVLLSLALVLSNAQQREIYDKYGLEGIEAAWQLGPHLSETDKVSLSHVSRLIAVSNTLLSYWR
jgi:DnaJ-class molecular chaperone